MAVKRATVPKAPAPKYNKTERDKRRSFLTLFNSDFNKLPEDYQDKIILSLDDNLALITTEKLNNACARYRKSFISECSYQHEDENAVNDSSTKGSATNTETRVVNVQWNFRCCCCGEIFDFDPLNYYKSTDSNIYVVNNHAVPICRSCVDKEFAQNEQTYGSRMACIIMCFRLDLPFVAKVYENVVKNNVKFSVGKYISQVNVCSLTSRTFYGDIVSGNLVATLSEIQGDKSGLPWTENELKNKRLVIDLIGYDPFTGYSDKDRKQMFCEIVKYFDDDIVDDPYMQSQVVQIVNNNQQIQEIDTNVNKLNPLKDAAQIKSLHDIKRNLVANNDKIAKENEISVKNRSNKDLGRSTLTYLMRDLRERNIPDAEENYYKQLYSEGTRWAIDMSTKSMKDHTLFDENDRQEIFMIQRELIQDKQKKLDDEVEKNRLLTIELNELKKNGTENKDNNSESTGDAV